MEAIYIKGGLHEGLRTQWFVEVISLGTSNDDLLHYLLSLVGMRLHLIVDASSMLLWPQRPNHEC